MLRATLLRAALPYSTTTRVARYLASAATSPSSNSALAVTDENAADIIAAKTPILLEFISSGYVVVVRVRLLRSMIAHARSLARSTNTDSSFHSSLSNAVHKTYGRVLHGVVDVAHAPELAKQFQVRSTPSAVAVVQGKVVDKYVCGTRESANRDALLTVVAHDRYSPKDVHKVATSIPKIGYVSLLWLWLWLFGSSADVAVLMRANLQLVVQRVKPPLLPPQHTITPPVASTPDPGPLYY